MSWLSDEKRARFLACCTLVLSSCRVRLSPRRLFAVRSRVGSVEGGVRISAYARPACDRCGSLEGKAPRAHMKTKCLIDDNEVAARKIGALEYAK